VSGRDGVMFMRAHVYDMTLCGNIVRNVALGLGLVGHFCYRAILNKLWSKSCVFPK